MARNRGMLGGAQPYCRIIAENSEKRRVRIDCHHFVAGERRRPAIS
ncbi:hypothetical protein [Belnapia rosea]|nr:hypothetical protein [Belnapia rosea]